MQNEELADSVLSQSVMAAAAAPATEEVVAMGAAMAEMALPNTEAQELQRQDSDAQLAEASEDAVSETYEMAPENPMVRCPAAA
jgi:hypothetical protein